MNEDRYIISDGKYYLARNYLGDYMAIDYIDLIYHEYGGRRTASRALIFDSVEEAENFMKRGWDKELLEALLPDAKIMKYNVCCNCLV